MTRKQRIGRAFGAAAPTYDSQAAIQRIVAGRLAQRIAALPLPPRPRVLEIGCGAGFLTRALSERLPDAEMVVTDLSPAMVAAARQAVGPAPRYLAMDGERPAFADGTFDLVCSSLTFQWFEDLEASLQRLCGLLKPGGRLAFATLLSDAFSEWRGAHADLGLAAGTPNFAAPSTLQHFSFEGATIDLEEDRLLERHAGGAAFVRALKEIGAGVAAANHKPLSAPQLKQVLERFEADGSTVTYHLGYGMLRRSMSARGVFVTGADTDVGKTVVAACLVRAMGADYWKPVQTGTATAETDAETVRRLAGIGHDRIHPSAYEYPEPLSPHAAAANVDDQIRLAALNLPNTDHLLVVEGAGGVLVPLNETDLMIDLIERLSLPVVVAVRSTLGTINHTLLTLGALRARGIAVLGVVMVGHPSRSNREAIERYGKVSVLAELPYTDDLSPGWVKTMAGAFDLPPPFRRAV